MRQGGGLALAGEEFIGGSGAVQIVHAAFAVKFVDVAGGFGEGNYELPLVLRDENRMIGEFVNDAAGRPA